MAIQSPDSPAGRGACCLALALLAAPAAAQNPHDPGYLDRELARNLGPPHMPEMDRERIDKVIIVSGRSVADEKVDGTYGKSTLGLAGGMDAGSRMGTITKEVGGVPIYFPIPGTTLPGAILGGLFGITQEQIQAFRDELTEDLVDSDSPPLRSDGLALDAFWEIRRRPELDSHLFSANLDIPDDADAVLHADFDELAIDVQGQDAVITTGVDVRVTLPASGRDVYRTRIRYQDRDTLENWTANDNALWHSYQNFARYYLGREVAADVFNRIDVDRELLPAVTADTRPLRKNDPRHLETQSSTPTLAWNLSLGDGGVDATLAGSIDPSQAAWDLEIFDDRQLVYDAQAIPSPSHTLTYPLEPCATYRWSVRPVYTIDGQQRFGAWMRFAYEPPDDRKRRRMSEQERQAEEDAARKARIDFGKGLIGRSISRAHAYTQDFATLEVACDR